MKKTDDKKEEKIIEEKTIRCNLSEYTKKVVERDLINFARSSNDLHSTIVKNLLMMEEGFDFHIKLRYCEMVYRELHDIIKKLMESIEDKNDQTYEQYISDVTKYVSTKYVSDEYKFTLQPVASSKKTDKDGTDKKSDKKPYENIEMTNIINRCFPEQKKIEEYKKSNPSNDCKYLIYRNELEKEIVKSGINISEWKEGELEGKKALSGKLRTCITNAYNILIVCNYKERYKSSEINLTNFNISEISMGNDYNEPLSELLNPTADMNKIWTAVSKANDSQRDAIFKKIEKYTSKGFIVSKSVYQLITSSIIYGLITKDAGIENDIAEYKAIIQVHQKLNGNGKDSDLESLISLYCKDKETSKENWTISDLESLISVFGKYQEKAENNWKESRELVLMQAYYDWVKEFFSLNNSNKNNTFFPNDECIKAINDFLEHSGDQYQVFRRKIGTFLKAILEYYGQLPFYKRERIVYDDICSVFPREMSECEKMEISFRDQDNKEITLINPVIRSSLEDQHNYIVGAKKETKDQKESMVVCAYQVQIIKGKITSKLDLSDTDKEKEKDNKATIEADIESANKATIEADIESANKAIEDALIRKNYDVSNIGKEEKTWAVKGINDKLMDQLIRQQAIRPKTFIKPGEIKKMLEANGEKISGIKAIVQGEEIKVEAFFRYICTLAQIEFEQIKLIEITKIKK